MEQRWADALGLVAERAMVAAVYEEEGESVAASADGDEAGAGEETDAGDVETDAADTDQPARTRSLPSSRADRFQVMVHINAGTLFGPAGEPAAASRTATDLASSSDLAPADGKGDDPASQTPTPQNPAFPGVSAESSDRAMPVGGEVGM